jgi:putative membrane protein
MARRAEARDVGEEPDVRFTLANERTYLAWIRTSLALIGGGLAAGQLLEFQSEVARLAVALPPIVLGAVLALTSYRRWEANQRALRLGRPLPAAGPPRILAGGIGALAVVVAVIVVVDALSR